MSWFRSLFGGGDPGWDDESREEQEKALGFMGRLGLAPECDELPGAKGPFGYCPTNPIPVNGPAGEVLYLNRLRAPSGVGFMFHRRGSVQEPSIPHPLDHYEVLAVDGTSRLDLYFSPYHPRRSQKVPEGLSRTSWRSLDEMHRMMIQVPGFGSTMPVPDFPWGLPEALRQDPGLKQISPGLGDSMARRVEEILQGLRRAGKA